MGRRNKQRVFVALQTCRYPWNQRQEMGTSFYHFEIHIEPKNATDRTEIWNAFCASGVAANEWRTFREYITVSRMRDTLVVRVMIGKVPNETVKLLAAKNLIDKARMPSNKGEDSCTWCRNAIQDLVDTKTIKRIDVDKAMEFIMAAADARGAGKSPCGDKVNFAVKHKFP